MNDDYDMGRMLQYEVPLLRMIIQHYADRGYTYRQANMLAVDRYGQELRESFNNGEPEGEVEARIRQELESDRIFQGIRGGQ